MGESRSISQVEDTCDPIITNRDVGRLYAVDEKTKLNPDAVAIPCGLVAKSFFNDTF